MRVITRLWGVSGAKFKSSQSNGHNNGKADGKALDGLPG